MLDVETKYTNMKKLILAFVVTVYALKPYFQCLKVEVIASCALHVILHKPDLAGRTTSWAAELGGYKM